MLIFLIISVLIIIRFIFIYSKSQSVYPRNIHQQTVFTSPHEEKLLQEKDHKRKVEEASIFVNTLEQLGYFKWTQPEHMPELKRFVEDNYLLHKLLASPQNPPSYRTYYWDEEINTGKAKESFLELLPTLERLGFKLTAIEQIFEEDYSNYQLIVNGEDFDLTPTDYNVPVVDFLDLVNLLLEKKLKVEERVYVINQQAGDSGELIFLDKALYNFLTKSGISEGNKPQLVESY